MPLLQDHSQAFIASVHKELEVIPPATSYPASDCREIADGGVTTPDVILCILQSCADITAVIVASAAEWIQTDFMY